MDALTYQNDCHMIIYPFPFLSHHFILFFYFNITDFSPFPCFQVNNTDAEGRLVLSDGCYYASKHLNPKVIIDIATLTGGQLGNEMPCCCGVRVLATVLQSVWCLLICVYPHTGHLCNLTSLLHYPQPSLIEHTHTHTPIHTHTHTHTHTHPLPASITPHCTAHNSCYWSQTCSYILQ